MVRPLRTAALLAAIAAGTFGLTFLQTWLVIVLLGPGPTTDAFFASVAVPQFLMNAVVGSVPFVLVPILASGTVDSDPRSVASLGAFVFLVTACLTVALTLTAGGWMRLVAPGLTTEAQGLAARLCVVVLAGIPVATFVSVATSHVYAQNKTVIAESAWLVANADALRTLLVLLPQVGIAAAAWAVAVRSCTQAVVLLPMMDGRELLRWDAPLTPIFLRRLRPLLLGDVIYKTDVIVGRVLSSLGPPGGLALFNVAQQLHFADATVASKATAGPLLPRLSSIAGKSECREFARLFRRTPRVLFVACLLGFAMLVLLGKAALGLMFPVRPVFRGERPDPLVTGAPARWRNGRRQSRKPPQQWLLCHGGRQVAYAYRRYRVWNRGRAKDRGSSVRWSSGSGSRYVYLLCAWRLMSQRFARTSPYKASRIN